MSPRTFSSEYLRKSTYVNFDIQLKGLEVKRKIYSSRDTVDLCAWHENGTPSALLRYAITAGEKNASIPCDVKKKSYRSVFAFSAQLPRRNWVYTHTHTRYQVVCILFPGPASLQTVPYTAHRRIYLSGTLRRNTRRHSLRRFDSEHG